MRKNRQETFTEKLYRYRGVVFVVSVPIALISFVLLLMPRALKESASSSSTNSGEPFEHSGSLLDQNAVESKRYSIIFDAGSSGSRVHVFCFDHNVDLVKMEDGELELFEQIKPGLSNYSDNPKKAADSLTGLLNRALDLVPKELHSSTPVRLGATAGLRLLPGRAADEILNEVRAKLRNSGLRFQDKWVSILDGADEGTYQWASPFFLTNSLIGFRLDLSGQITVNYLLGNLKNDYQRTVGVVDLGGGSVQMSYAVSEEASKNAPEPPKGAASYIVTLKLLGQTFYLYVHSYLRYGLYAVRGEILRLVAKDSTCACLPKGVDASYRYAGENFPAVANAEGADVNECEKLVLKALKTDEFCSSLSCTFGGIWSGGGGAGQDKLLVASFFFDKAAEVGILEDPKAAEQVIKPSQFKDAADRVCATSFEEMKTKFPSLQASDFPYICVDLLYEYTLLVKGFGVKHDQEITLVKRVIYKGAEVEAAWALGMAIESLSA